MKIIHCADLHLDSAMDSRLPSVKARERRAELRRTFSNLIDYALAGGFDAVLICGDLFDEEKVPQPATVANILKMIENASSLRFYYLCGNHEGTSWLDLYPTPENLHVIAGTGWTSFREEDVTITGCDISSGTPSWDELRLDPDTYNIVMLHGTVEGGKPDIPLKKLAGRNVDYLALGHIHSFKDGKLDKRGVYAYSGCLEGRGFDETGEKGFVVLDTNVPSYCFVPANGRRIAVVKVPVDGCAAQTELESRMKDIISTLDRGTILRVVFCGSLSQSCQLDTADLERILEPEFYYAEVKDDTVPEIPLSELQSQQSLKGVFARLVMSSDISDDMKGKVIQVGLKALRGERPEL